MGCDFIFSICRVPGLPQDEFAEAVTTKVTNMSVPDLQMLREILDDHGLYVDFDEDLPQEDELKEVRKIIIDQSIGAERRLANGPTDMSSFSMEGKDYYISGLQSWGDGTDSMNSIQWLLATEFEELGHDR